MPCAFLQPKLMAMHAALAMQHLQHLAATTTERERRRRLHAGAGAPHIGGAPHIDGAPHIGGASHAPHAQPMPGSPRSTPCLLGGDWNLKPSDPLYRLLTSGRMDPALTLAQRHPMVKVPPLARSGVAPQLGSCTSSGRAWRPWAARHSQSEAQPLGAPSAPRGPKRAASKGRSPMSPPLPHRPSTIKALPQAARW